MGRVVLGSTLKRAEGLVREEHAPGTIISRLAHQYEGSRRMPVTLYFEVSPGMCEY